MNVWQLIVTVFGGLSIFIYGMGLMSESLTQIAGALVLFVLTLAMNGLFSCLKRR